MEPITILSAATGYILRAIAHSKTADNAKEEVLGRFWKWIRPKFLHESPALEAQPEAPATAEQVQKQLAVLMKDESFYRELEQQVSFLQQAGVTGKNIVHGNLSEIDEVTIGDKTYHPGESYTWKNVVDGSVKGVKKFTLGDGH
jgi:hypothetical protein